MVYPPTILKVFKEAYDSFYFIRFMDHIVSKRCKGPYYFDVKAHQCKPLISGVLEDIKTGDKYNTFADFYNKVTGSDIGIYDEVIFHHIYYKPHYNLHRLISMLKDEDLLNFTDEKYRIFTMVRDLRERVKHYTGFDMNSHGFEKFLWKNDIYTISINEIRDINGRKTAKCLEFLEEYESGEITDLYYNKTGTDEYHKICQ